jgi:putative photosynthetic complex assembly protein
MTYIHIDEETTTGSAGVPKFALVLAGGFAAAVIILAAVARIAHTGTLGEQAHAQLVTSRALVFSDHADGSIGVYDEQRSTKLADLTGSGGFVRGALRGLAFQRRLAHVGPDVPFYLVKWSDGRLTLDDSSTANHLELQAFGSENEAAFDKLLMGSTVVSPPVTAAVTTR